jgi:predicted enzyme related to lactoylglutathione lyase
MATGLRGNGDFCWINVLTPHPEKERGFFTKVLRWSYAELPTLGHRIQVRGTNVGGIFDTVSPRFPRGTTPGIGVMIKVASADETVARARKLGGLARDAFDIAGIGRMAECFDPNGAQFDIWEPKSMPGFDVDSSLHGAPSWFEILTRNVSRDREFYSTLFGWTATEYPIPEGSYVTFSNGSDAPIAGMMTQRPELTSYTAHWGVYFTVENVDEVVRLAELMGASAVIRPKDMPGVGRLAYLRSREGVYFHVITYGVAANGR